MGTIRNIDLADDGRRFHAVLETPSKFPFWQDVGGTARVASMSRAWTIFGSVPSIAGDLSDDGSVLLTPTWGLIAVRRDVAAYGAHVDNIFWNYDEDGDLVVRVQVRASDDIKQVSVLLLFDRWIRPSALYAFGEDPTYVYRTGLELEALKDEPGTFEGTLDLTAEATVPLDEHYSFRVTVQQGPEASTRTTSTGFADFMLLP